jgi:hypothetical protein
MRITTGVAIAWLSISAAFGAEPLTEHTLKLSPGEKPPPATIEDMRWLTGHWKGEAFGGKTEELWAEPLAGSMSGMFRLASKGKIVFYELMVVSEHEGSLVFRLKHFNADVTGWEEKNEVQAFPLVARKDGALQFHGMSFHPDGDKLTVYLAIEHKDKPLEEAKFTYQRVR